MLNLEIALRKNEDSDRQEVTRIEKKSQLKIDIALHIFIFISLIFWYARRLTSFDSNYSNKYLTKNEYTHAISGAWSIDAARIYHNF